MGISHDAPPDSGASICADNAARTGPWRLVHLYRLRDCGSLMPLWLWGSRVDAVHADRLTDDV